MGIAILILAVAASVRARIRWSANRCINNLRMIDRGKHSWSLANKIHAGGPPVAVQINSYIKGDTTPVCPAGGAYSYEPVGSVPTCNITDPIPHSMPYYYDN